MSEGGAGGGEKTQEPTPKRLEDARKKGDVAKSAEVGVAASYLALFAVLFVTGGDVARSVGETLSLFLDQSERLTGQILGPGGGGLSAAILATTAWYLAPVFVVPLAATLAAYAAQRAIVFSLDKLKPKGTRIDPISVAKQKFGPTGLVEFAKSAFKLIAISIIAGALLLTQISEIIGAARASPGAVVVTLGGVFMRMMTGILIVTMLIAFIDFAWQRHDHLRRLRMSYQEIRDEAKETEGDPQLKARRRQRAVEVSKRQMMADVPKADVVIVNPVHVAVALKWSRKKGTAPVCVAKGVDEIALKIREIAGENGVPLHRDVACARALYELVEIGDEIPPEHYRAVAAAIRFAEAMRRKARAQGRSLAGYHL